MRIVLAIGVFALAAATAASVHAQGLPMVAPVYGPPRITWFGPNGDASGPSGATGLASGLILEPIRLGLVGMTTPARLEPGCPDAVETTGAATAATPGHPLQYAVGVQLVPRLTLFGFSRAGCALESSAGTALVYTLPIRRDIFLTGAAGVLNLPHNGPGGSSVMRMQLRGDVVFARPQGRAYTVGFGTTGRAATLTFGGLL